MKTKKALTIIIFLVFSVFLIEGSAATFDTVVSFGDSLSDNGNLFQFDLELLPDPDPYFEGRFSNGPVWVEYLTGPDLLNVPLVGRALGGAETGGHTPPGLIDQVVIYVNTSSDPSPDTLFIIWIGHNDFLNGSTDFQSSVANIRTALLTLADFGIRHLLILNHPNLGAIPRYLGTTEASTATTYSQNFNVELASMLDEFEKSNPQITLHVFDVFRLFEDIRNNPAGFGFSNVTDQSPNFAVADNFDNSAGYLFWDDIHPTTEAHAVLADRVFSALTD